MRRSRYDCEEFETLCTIVISINGFSRESAKKIWDFAWDEKHSEGTETVLQYSKELLSLVLGVTN